jgi:hypothetical protein
MCRAISRFHLLEPHLEHRRELRSVADGSGVCFRTLQRWVAQYRRSGLAALARQSRFDRGNRRLGGYLARGHDPPPGNMVLWRGVARLTDIQLGFLLGAQIVGN